MSQGEVIFLQIVFLVVLILHTFAGYSFCHLLYLQFRQYRLGKPAWGGWTWRALTFVFAAHYLNELSGMLSFTFSDGKTGESLFVAALAHVVTRPLMGPLLLQLFYVTERSRLTRHWLWQALLRTAWAIAIPIALVRGLWSLGITIGWASLPDKLLIVSDAAFAASGILSVIIIWMSHRPGDSAFRRRQRRWNLGFFGVLFASMILQPLWWPYWLDILVKFLPGMTFVLVTVYYGERLTFFDVFAKRGLLFFMALVILTCHFALISPYLTFNRLGFVKSWMTALTLVPLVLAMPWIYSRLNSWVDRAWLGRRFSAVGAATFFAESVQGATSEPDLIERSESSLSYIFQTKVCIDLIDPTESDHLTALVRINGIDEGVIRVFPRPDEVPFLSEDAELLRVLAHSFGSMIESQRLRDQRLGQEQREKELVLNAAQSELKALRAQINPHFLFNALNTIAALIPQKPGQAEQTVEQLAEVFRYTVRRSDREWVRLADEIEFVRSYLEIERARFGERLHVRIEVDDATKDVRIPAVIIQTLAENAIKHGISCVRGSGMVTILARMNGDKLFVSVEDNGPGFEKTPQFDSLPISSNGGNGGYGLKNVQERLYAYYGPDARLRFGRDAGSETTLVSFEIPVIVDSVESD